MHYTAARYPSAIGRFRVLRSRMGAAIYVIMGSYEMALSGRVDCRS